MKKKAVNKMNPTITNLPIAVSDNPVVIDLPDGQKLVLGKMSSGSVIEVATWRGTGRPDSRTSRLMLGMSDTLAPVTETVPAVEVKQVKKISLPFGTFTLPNLKGALVKFKSIKKIISSAFASVMKAIEKSKSLTPVERTTELDINAWIENISREVESKGAQRRATTSKKAAPIKRAKKKSR